MVKIGEMKEILQQIKVPKKQQNERTALTMLALAGLKETDKWKNVTEAYMRPHDIIEFINTNNSDYLQKARKYGHFTGYKN
jgi:DNA-binding Xre family transcriptional regulator